MRLGKAQREKVLKWIAAGLKSDEINARAAKEQPPFSCTRQQLAKYRQSRGKKIKDIVEKSETSALKRGLALKEKRVEKLQKLAALMEKDLFGRKKRNRLWVEDRKGIGSGEIAEVFDFETFNTAEVQQYRGILDDIAREMGHRATKLEAGDGEAIGVFQVIRAPGAKEAG